MDCNRFDRQHPSHVDNGMFTGLRSDILILLRPTYTQRTRYELHFVLTYHRHTLPSNRTGAAVTDFLVFIMYVDEKPSFNGLVILEPVFTIDHSKDNQNSPNIDADTFVWFLLCGSNEWYQLKSLE